MAPNRKNISSLLSTLSVTDLESLQSSVQPKFLPLTHPAESQQQQPEPEKKQQQQQSASYWEWPTDKVVEEEAAADLFSASRIESNLVKAAEALEEPSELNAENDADWAESDQQQVSEEAKPVVRAQHETDASYWEWAAEQDANKVAIRNILADERAREQTSAAAIESNEAGATTASSHQQVQAAKQSNDQYWQWNSAKVATHTADSSHPNDNYWDWEAKPASRPIQAIVEYEAARELLTASNIVRQLQAAAPASSCGQKASSDDYWNYSEQYGDEYWQEKPAAVVAAAGSAGYWDW